MASAGKSIGCDNTGKCLYIRTFGCQMAARDSEWVMGSLLERGFCNADSAEEADVIIFNTCSVRKHAEERAISNMGQLRKLKDKNPNLILGIMGCTAEYYGGDLFKRLPFIDFVCGTAKINGIADLIDRVIEKRKKELSIGGLSNSLPEINPHYRSNKKNAYVLISRGCDNFCSYCIVPYVRGPERSRKPDAIIEEIGDLFGRGCSNITLLGQNVNSYGKDLNDGVDFVRLLETIDKMEGKKNIEFLTSHPKDVSIRLFEAMGRLKGLSKHLHLPLQSGSDKILKAMKRGYDSKYYLKMVKDFKRIVPDGALTTDIIVGFPGEKRKDYEATKIMLKKIAFDGAYIFKYSPRPPASSSRIKDDVPKDVKEKRHSELLNIQKSISKRKNRKAENDHSYLIIL